MLTHALEFDADKDGKLSKEELEKFIADFVQRHPGPGGAGPGRRPEGGLNSAGGPQQRGPEGARPEGTRPEGGPNGTDAGGRPTTGDRPQRPRRPE
jgi:hypothetical protein